MKSVLLVVFTGVEQNGVCNYFRQWIKNTPPDKFSYTLYCFENIKDQKIYSELKEFGVRFIEGNCHIPPETFVGKLRRFKKLWFDLSRAMKNYDYDICHIATGAINYASMSLFIAKMHNVNSRIFYATNNPEYVPLFKKLIRYFTRKIIVNSANVLSSCS